MSDLLCFEAFKHFYGIPLDIVKETFDEQKVTPVPCLHHVFAGLCNHKGIVYPVLSFSQLCNEEVPHRRTCMLLLQIDKYQVILRMNNIPFFIHADKLTKDIAYEGGNDLLVIDRFCEQDDIQIYVINMKRIMDNLATKMLEIPSV